MTEIDVGEVLERERLGRFHLLTVGLCFLIVVVDGMDFGAGNIAAPAIIQAFHAEKSAMGLVFGWMYSGILVGSVVLGAVGDRYGRKVGALTGVLAYTIPAVLTPLADSMTTLMALRFITGLGIGGVIPNTIALATENAPKRYRASLVVVVFVGYSLGTALSAQVAAHFMPAYGWGIVFLAAGGAGIVLAAVLALFLPESICYLALRAPQSAALRGQMRLLAPAAPAGPEIRYVLRREMKSGRFSPRLLFAENLKRVTPLLWLAYFAESLTFMTLLSWLPVLLVTGGLTQTDAAVTVGYGAIGGILVLLLLARPLDRWGPAATVVSGTITIASLLALALPGLAVPTIMTLAAIAMMCGAGSHNSLNGTVGLFYPTAIRANGVGFATGMGRFASIVGPTLTGFLLSAKLPLATMLQIMAAPYIVVVLTCLVLGRIYKHSFAPSAPQPALAGVEPVATAGDPL